MLLRVIQSEADAAGWAELRTLGAEVRVCAPPDCAELLARVGVPLVPIGVWR